MRQASQFKNLDGKILQTDGFANTLLYLEASVQQVTVDARCVVNVGIGRKCVSRVEADSSIGVVYRRQQSRSKSSGRQSQRGGEHISQYSYRKQTHQHTQKQHDIDCVREDFEHFHFETVTFIDGVAKHDVDELKVNLDVKLDNCQGNHTMKVKVDTGAQGNLLPLRVYRRMFPEYLDASGFPKYGTTKAQHVKLSAYNGTDIPQCGSVTLACGFNGNWLDTELFLADAPGPILLGLPSTLALNIITPNCSTTSVHSVDKSVPIPNKETLQNLYPDRFEGIGQFPGKCHITLKEDAEPGLHPARKYPIQLKDELKAELDRMESLGVIAKVTEPTDRVSSLAFSRKDNGKLRVCLDPSDLNRSIKRTYHKTPTLEEITHKFCGATVFSKLDARHGYWSVTLDDNSSVLTTFNTPFGRYRFRRLPFGLRISQDIFQREDGYDS
ncbi:uncharacterized protein K02A2.6-like [Haliotis rubra]|uniref:uncharacterized protein K02A2.6-like n=1 Tax=Haliotis rubra TaxID=36100 RepID=UPI001EE55AC0|nr:uncharacterized protein K02A2.6-like [Haliotis rubra]